MWKRLSNLKYVYIKKQEIVLAYPKFQILANFCDFIVFERKQYLTDFFIEEFMVIFYKWAGRPEDGMGGSVCVADVPRLVVMWDSSCYFLSWYQMVSHFPMNFSA